MATVSHLFPGGSYACLLGPSGCGKSSTLRMIAGHESVTFGQITLAGKEVQALDPAKRGTAKMPTAQTQPLFEQDKRLNIGFYFGHAELTPNGHRFSTSIVGGPKRPDHRQKPQGPSARLVRTPAKPHLSASGKLVF